MSESAGDPGNPREELAPETPQEEQPAGNFPSLIVGVGASAGGYEAFKELLENLPVPSGLALVFIQHLDPQHQSMLPTLLSRSTRMKVMEAADGMALGADAVYVCPPNANLLLLNGVLTVQTIGEGAPRHKTIDGFFHSLATDQGGRWACCCPGRPPTACWGSRLSRRRAASPWCRTRNPPSSIPCRAAPSWPAWRIS